MKKVVEIESCVQCPFCEVFKADAFGYAKDYVCKKTPGSYTNKVNKIEWKYTPIKENVRWETDAPSKGHFPSFCPLDDLKEKSLFSSYILTKLDKSSFNYQDITELTLYPGVVLENQSANYNANYAYVALTEEARTRLLQLNKFRVEKIIEHKRQ